MLLFNPALDLTATGCSPDNPERMERLARQFGDRGAQRANVRTVRLRLGAVDGRGRWLARQCGLAVAPALPAADRLGATPGENAQRPGRKRRDVIQPGQPAQDLQPGLLRHVARKLAVAGEPPCMREKPGLPARGELACRRPVAEPGRSHEVGVIGALLAAVGYRHFLFPFLAIITKVAVRGDPVQCEFAGRRENRRPLLPLAIARPSL